MPGLPPMPHTQEQVVAALVDCGLDPAGLGITYQDYLQSDVVRIGAAAKAGPAQFACIRNATQYVLVEFDDDRLRKAYDTYVNAALRPDMVASARSQLAGMDKLDGLPQFPAFGSQKAFLQALEAHCGWDAGQVFREGSPGSWTMAPEALGGEAVFEKASCLFAALMAQDADLSAAGLKIGIVGNEAASGE